ncbi:hypothetical protein AVDCRST_MAG94-3894 [uncultured Leptolyngbya sp.]|uniref:Glucose/Sorbosone dehydrogenase domain-containing protein n=1 Tax=uncultured Leptolyngbya sp. TaxID=332963 RepID=A0A6J4MUX7_9CYAN|nr:hypothetical protein AVDCRST_MAG94-3894 [uncultured Leptolyngbya sp.]
MKELNTIVGFCLVGLASCVAPESNNISTSSSLATIPSQPKAVAFAQTAVGGANACKLIESGYGPQGTAKIRVEQVASGLHVPWGIAFVPNGDMIVTERRGQVRLVRGGKLLPAAIATVPVSASGEGGLLGIAAHPNVVSNRLFYLYYTTDKNGRAANRVERWKLSSGGGKASLDKIIIDNIPVAQYHDGGRIRFGPDGMLYVGTGDARNPETSQNVNSLSGKILRLTPDGQVPKDNPFPGKPAYILGVRNVQGFDWINASTLYVTDHGPSGDLGLYGHDEVNVATAGDNLGWPRIYGCKQQQGSVHPLLTWQKAVPPGGAAVYTGNAIPEWKGSLLVGTLRSQHLHRVELNASGQLQRHEVYLRGGNSYGRLREVIMGPDQELYVTTSNCDGRGSCPRDGDKILRITR